VRFRDPTSTEKMATLASVLGTETISVFVGTERTQYVVHKQLLCNKVPYFSKLLNGSFSESKAGKIVLTDDMEDLPTFALFLHWLYSGSVPAIPIKDSWDDFSIDNLESCGVIAAETPHHHLYYLADRWCIPLLKNLTIDRIRRFHNATDSYVHPKLIIDGYANTPEGSSLRRYLSNIAAYSCSADSDEYNMVYTLAKTIRAESQEIWVDIMGVVRDNYIKGGMEDPDSVNKANFHDPIPGS